MRLRLAVCLASYALALSAACAAAGPPAGTETDVEIARGLTADRFHLVDDQMHGLIETLLAENPWIASAWTRSRSSFEQVDGQRSLPDPLISYRYYAETPETRVGPQEHQFELSQTLPWGGKRRLQAERAENAAAGQTWEAENLERRAVADLKRSYFEAAYLQEALRVNGEERELLRRFEGIALKRYATGQGIQQSVVKVQTEISRLDDRETDLRKRLGRVSRKISELIGRPEMPLTLRPIALGFPEVTYGRGELERLAVTEHPWVNAVERRIAADQVWTERRKLAGRPDFRVGLGYGIVGRRDDPAGTMNPPEDNGQNILAVSVGINIPLYRKRIRAGIADVSGSRSRTRPSSSTR
jgi:outer membrane protein TolC